MNILIFGAGSIGNHLANASKRLNWNVTILDIDPKALERTKEEIYPQRYGSWDTSINLIDNIDKLEIEPDLIIVGTPPDSHIKLASIALKYRPKAILIEKPLCTPSRDGLKEFKMASANCPTKIFVGYNHILGKACQEIKPIIESKDFGKVITIDVEFREHWGGIFSAHNWLSGPAESYLGFYKNGGGATGEHSHAINLWQYLAELTKFGEVIEVNAYMDFVKENNCNYDRLSLINLKSDKNLVGRVIQDVVTKPSRKWARIQFEKGFIEWNCESNTNDSIKYQENTMSSSEIINFPKTRPDDFIAELKHIDKNIQKDSDLSPISLERGCDTMAIISASYESGLRGKSITLHK